MVLGPAMFFYAAMMLLTEVLTPLPDVEEAKPSGLGDIKLPTSTEARKIPIIWGTVQIIGSNLVWYGDVQIWGVTTKVKSGLGLKSKNVVTGYRYWIGPQYALCRGEIDGLLRFWVDDDLLYDSNEAGSPIIVHGDTMSISEPTLYGGNNAGGGYVGDFEFFAGTPLQLASNYLSTFQAVAGTTNAYRNTCYLAPKASPIEVGTSLTLKNPKFEVVRIVSANGLALADPTVNTDDANPANVLHDILTNSEWGLGILTADIDLTSFTDAAAVLKTEGNGFSFVLDRPEDILRTVERVEDQIDGSIYLNAATGKWTLKLARNDYDIATITAFDSSNIVSIETFGRATWEDTKNEVTAEITLREDDYAETFIVAQDIANIEIQSNVVKPMAVAFPGVKNNDLGNSLAWRELRGNSFPLAHAKITTDRTTYATTPVEVVKVSFAREGFEIVDLPMRIKSVDAGSLLDNRITYELVEDIFFHIAGSFDSPTGSLWVPPVDEPQAFPADQQMAISAPRKLVHHAAFGSNDEFDVTDPMNMRVAYAGRRQAFTDLQFEAFERSNSGVPSGDFHSMGFSDFCLMGTLKSALLRGTAVPTTTIILESTLDTQARILEYFPDGESKEQIGFGLGTLLMIGDEFLLPLTAVAGSGSEVDFGDVYRGVMDTVQGDHIAGTKVFLLYSGMGLSKDGGAPSHNTEVLLLPHNWSGTVPVADATTISFARAYRFYKAIPPSEMSLSGTRFATTVSLEDTGTGESDGIALEILRRSRHSTDQIANIEAEVLTTNPDNPVAEDLRHDVEVVDDPDALAVSLYTHDFGTANSGTITRLDILQNNAGVLPTRLQFRVRSQVEVNADYFSVFDLTWDFDLTSALTGDFEFGALDTNDDSNIYTADATGVHNFTLSSAFTAGDVYYRIDGGSWVSMIAAGLTTGATASVTTAQTLEVEHRSSDVGAQKLLTMTAPGAGTDAFAVLYV